MHSAKIHGNQAGGTSKAFRFREKLALVSAANAIEAAVEDIESGRDIKAASDLRTLAGAILDEARAALADLRSLGVLPPLHRANDALHACRQGFLERRAKAEGWQFHWEDGHFIIADEAAGFWLTVDPCDNWTASTSGSPDWLICDSGLLTLIAFLNGTALAEELSRCAAWLQKGGRQ